MTTYRAMLIAAATVLCGTMVAQAQMADVKTYYKTAVAGKESTFDFFYAVKLDCTPIDWMEVRIVQQPDMGKAEITKGTVLMQWQTDDGPFARVHTEQEGGRRRQDRCRGRHQLWQQLQTCLRCYGDVTTRLRAG
jgi:hypothetical protein